MERLLPGPLERVWADRRSLAEQLNGVKPRGFWSSHDLYMKEFVASI